MKKLTASLILLFTIALLSQSIEFKYFTAKSIGDDILLEWSLEEENDVDHFKIQRQIQSNDSYKYIYISTMINPEGAGTHYRFNDENLFITKGGTEKPQDESIKIYRVEISLKDGRKVYSDEAVLTHNISSVKKTWGMLKEMFR